MGQSRSADTGTVRVSHVHVVLIKVPHGSVR